MKKSGLDYERELTDKLAKELVAKLRTLPAAERAKELERLCEDDRVRDALTKAVGPGALSNAIANLTELS
jgi:hypothetical protein